MKRWALMAALVGAIANCHPSGASKLMERRPIVDAEGVLRWAESETEVALFGVNYTAMFAFGFRALGYTGVDREKTIDQDLAHLARLGVDGVRLCLWGDWELTDHEGNLLDNEHLRLTDYSIAQAQSRGMHILLTPIVTYSAQWPEPEEDGASQGFSNLYSRVDLATDPNARKAQANYLRQLMEHVNPYTGRAYKDDPAICLVELINEPVNPSTMAETLEYIEDLAKAVRETGCRKPLFYNASQGMWDGLVESLTESSVEGVTFGWYPTGLLAGHSLRGDFLPTVDNYPEMRDPALASKAKLVYEFDAADVPGSHMYPAMARTFRAGGAQSATMFSYDSLPLAASNTEYQTHYLNLVYTPNKAISLLIAGEAFRRLPRGESYGRYPENTRFGPFRVSYEEDLSEMVTETELLYSNDTQTEPPHPELLERVVGCGSSPVVAYEGTGSYFLEKLEEGVWRLEVYPDAVWVRDPYGQPCLDREVSRVLWRQWPMKVRLPDLGECFRVEPLNEGNTYRVETKNGSVPTRPGVYLLVREGASASKWSAESSFGQLKLGEFVAPAEEERPTVVLHDPPRELLAGEPFPVTATVASSQLPERVTLHLRGAGEEAFRRLEMERERGYHWAVEVPVEWVVQGELEYCISVEQGGAVRTYPADVAGEPGEESFAWPAPQVLYAPERGDTSLPAHYHGPEAEVVATAEVLPAGPPATYALQLTASALGDKGSAAVTVPPARGVGTLPAWRGGTAVVIRARSENPSAAARIELVERGGVVYASDFPLIPAWHDWWLSLRDFVPSKGSQFKRQVDLSRLESVNLVLHPAEGAESAPRGDYDLQVQSIALRPLTSLWHTHAALDVEPLVLFDAERDHGNLERRAGYRERLVPGHKEGKQALHIGVDGFGQWLWEVSCRHWFGDSARLQGEHSCLFDTLRITVRAPRNMPDAVQVALADRHGSAWGATIHLITGEWHEVRLPLALLSPATPPEVPRPWPLPIRPGDTDRKPLSVGELVAVQVSFGPGVFPRQGEQAAAIEIEEIVLEVTHGRNTDASSDDTVRDDTTVVDGSSGSCRGR
jgi:hypothetical protein